MNSALLFFAIIHLGLGEPDVTVDSFEVTWAECLASREALARAPHRPEIRVFVYCDDAPWAYPVIAKEMRRGR